MVFIKSRIKIYQEIYNEYMNMPGGNGDKDKLSRMANKMAVALTWKRFNSMENKTSKEML